MFESNIIIKGGAFSKQTTLNNILAKRMNIVYGRNGSGKSTIARAFREQQPARQTIRPIRDYQLSFDGSGSLPSKVCEHAFVFNEDFIDENVKVSDGLKSIIRIGASAELDGPIQDAKDKIQVYKDQLKPLSDELDILDGNGAGSINKANKDLRDSLKKPGGFISRLDRLEGRSHNLVSSQLTPIINYNKNDTLASSIGEMASQLDASIDRYLSIQSGAVIYWQQPDFTNLPDIAIINEILTRTVRPAALSDEEKAILDELSNELAAENFISKTQDIIIDSSRSFCPLCHQPLSPAHKHTLEERLLKFRDKTILDFKDEIAEMQTRISLIDAILPALPDSDYGKDIQDAAAKLSDLNAFISNIQSALDSKAANPFATVSTFNQEEFDSLVAECTVAVDNVANDVRTYNDSLKEKDKLWKEIEKANIRLAYHENKSLVDTLNTLTARREQVDNQINSLKSQMDDQETKINTLRAKIDQVDDAREQINKYLDIIFGINKLRLVPAGKDKYKLQIKSGDIYEDIPPQAISSGERNALALAYFFACVMEKKDKNYDYSDPTLLVIDDPVSSFDIENKAGVISLIANQCKKVLDGNSESKVLVLTHDYTTLRDLCDQRKQRITPYDGKDDVDWYYCSLSPKHTLKTPRCSSINENMAYGETLWSIYHFAAFSNPDEYDCFDGIGNTIRRFAESYASYVYKCSWFELFSNDLNLLCVPPELRERIRSFAVRNVLNSESHGLLDSYAPAEVQRSARVLLTYMLYADERHLRAYLVGKNTSNETRIDTIRGWFI